MKTIKSIALAATLVAATAAHASFFNFDHDQADLVSPRASFVFGAMNWAQQVGGTDISGRLTGQLTYHGVVAGCAKVRAIWRNEAGQEVARDLSANACSNSSLPSLPVAVSEGYTASQLRGARVELLLKEFNAADFRVVQSRAMKAGGG
jgi:hypothetical protein